MVTRVNAACQLRIGNKFRERAFFAPWLKGTSERIIEVVYGLG